jgi:hypothetical protein
MSKKISFGSSESYMSLDLASKQKIIDYLYSNLNLSKHRFIMLNNVSKLEFLRDNEHYVSPSFKGFNYFFMFMNLEMNGEKRKYCVAIDRRKLSYHKDQVELKSVFMVKVHMKVSESIFNGTIFDGKLIESSNKFIFLIQDCFYLMGKKILDMEMSQKMGHLDNILKIHFSDPNVCDNFSVKLNKLCKYDGLENLINNVLPSCSIPTQGLVFYPKYSGVSIIHIEKKVDKVDIETNQAQVVESKTYDMIYNFVDFIKTRVYSYEKGSKTRKFWLSKSNIPDVYNLSEKEDGEKLGIAHIPNVKISHLCDEKVKEDKPVKFNCVYHTKFKKWVPVSVS